MILELVTGLALLQTGPRLIGFCSIPADLTVEGPTSGQFFSPINARIPPFVLRQPVQGISSLQLAPASRALALADNGYGLKSNSPDFGLVFHSLHLDLERRRVRIERTFALTDPYRKVPWPILGEMESYPGAPFPVDATIRERRWLTGWDFDPEGFAQSKDGSLWIGEEFGPFLLNVDLAGRLLRSPIAMPAVCSPDHPLLCTEPDLPRGRGIAGLTVDKSGRFLYLIFESSLRTTRNLKQRQILEFDARKVTFTGKTWEYICEEEGHSIGDIVHVDKLRFLIVETDTEQGLRARFKRIFAVDLTTGAKVAVADLLAIDDSKDANGDGSLSYGMPYRKIESLAIKDSTTIVVANDNDFPYSSARFPGLPDNTEFAVIKLPKPLNAAL